MDRADRPEPDLPPAEAARVRRRERERSAKARELMRTGQAKAFKQIRDVQAKRAAEIEERRSSGNDTARGIDRARDDDRTQVETGDRDPATR